MGDPLYIEYYFRTLTERAAGIVPQAYDQWAQLTGRTLDTTDGQTTNALSVADRAARIPYSRTGS